MSSSKKRGLGKGLGALLQDPDTDITSKGTNSRIVGSISNIPIDQIETNPFQPRTEFEKAALEELATSIKQHGIIQPITVRKMSSERFQLISGERRFRASQIAGLEEVAAYIRIANDQEMLEMALVENIQRENLNAIEVALSYRRLLDECKLTHEELSKKVAKNRTTITNHLRLLNLPPAIRAGIMDKKISMGHARAIVSMDNENAQMDVFRQTVGKNLSVRQVEELVRNYTKKPTGTTKKNKVEPNEKEKEFTSSLSEKLGAKVALNKSNKSKGKIVINFNSKKELEKIIEELS